jgi:hypothetical protein
MQAVFRVIIMLGKGVCESMAGLHQVNTVLLPVLYALPLVAAEIDIFQRPFMIIHAYLVLLLLYLSKKNSTGEDTGQDMYRQTAVISPPETNSIGSAQRELSCQIYLDFGIGPASIHHEQQAAENP